MKNKLQFAGRVSFITNPETRQTKAGKPFTFKEIKIDEVDVDQYPQSLSATLPEKFFDKVKLGDKVSVNLNSRAWSYEGKIYNSLSIWGVYPMQNDYNGYSQPTEQQAAQPQATPTTQESQNTEPKINPDDLPF